MLSRGLELTCFIGGNLEEALKQYTKAQEYGITRAGPHIRNVRRIHSFLFLYPWH